MTRPKQISRKTTGGQIPKKFNWSTKTIDDQFQNANEQIEITDDQSQKSNEQISITNDQSTKVKFW